MTSSTVGKDEPTLRSRIRSVLEQVYRQSGITGVYHEMRSTDASLVGRGFCRLCAGCLRHPQAASFCHSNACTAGLQGHSVGNVWYFRCWLGIDGFALPVAPQGEIVGAVEIAGWFGGGEKQNSLNRVLSRLADLDSQAPTERYVSALQAMPELAFPDVQAIAEFALEVSLSEGVNRAGDLEFRARVFQQQQRLNARLRERGGSEAPRRPVHQALAALVEALAGADRHARLSALDEVLCSILLENGDDLDQVRAALTSLIAAVFHERIRQGEAWGPALKRMQREVLELDAAQSVEEAFLQAEEWVLHRLLGSADPADREKHSASLSSRVVAWLERNYGRRVTVNGASRALGASVSSITHRLKQETGKGFSDHLRTIRVSEAKRLLAYTDSTLGEIAATCGFRDASYFTKVFRAEINLTPSQFRRLLE